jgi:K+-transporting ATPase ATPase C chain
MKDFALSSALYIGCSIVIALYTIIIYFLGHNFWPHQASGSLILDEASNIRGSYLLAQPFNGAQYFKTRPSMEFDRDCDVALYNTKLRQELISKYDKLKRPYDVTMIMTSGSWYDPFITRREAIEQAAGVSKARGVKLEEIHKLIDEYTIYNSPPFFELDIVNTVLLNSRLGGY